MTVRDGERGEGYTFHHRRGGEGLLFDQEMARGLPGMIRGTIPGYDLMLELCTVIAGEYAADDSLLFDLGCALGDTTAALRAGCRGKRCRIVAVDSAPAMIVRCRDRFPPEEGLPPVVPLCADIRDIRVADASVVALNLTLQFLPHRARLPLLRAVRHGMKRGAALLLSEVVVFEDQVVGKRLVGLQGAFKRRGMEGEEGRSAASTPFDALLDADTIEQHLHRLHLAGFARVMPWFQCLNFASILAIR